MEDSWENRTLLSLRRKYSKDETVKAMEKKLKKLEVENGQLKSEIDHLSHLLTKRETPKKKHTEEDLNAMRLNSLAVQKEKMYKKLRKKLDKKEELLKRLNKSNNELIMRVNKIEGNDRF